MPQENFTLTTLSELLAAELDTPKGKTHDACKAVFETMAKHAMDGGRVAIHAFGIFKVKETAAKVGRNPRTGEKIDIPAKKKLVFKASKALNETVKPAKKTPKKK